MREVAVVAAGMTRFGELWQSSLRDLWVDAALETLANARADHVDAIFVGNMSAGQFVGQEHLGPLLADQLGMRGTAAVRVESACASGGAALRAAFAGLYAMIARAHMHQYGTTEEDLAWVAVKNHRHGAKNPRAQFRREVTLEQVMSSALVAAPLRLLHCSPVSDGAAAVILCPLDQAKKYTDRPVKIIGSGLASAPMALADRQDPAF